MTFARTLFYRCVIAMLRHERKKARIRNKRQFVLPGFEHLPESIVTDGGKTVPLIDLNYSGVRSFYWSLTRPYARKMKGDPEIIDAKALLDKMRPYAKEKVITVRQVLLLDGGPTAAEQSA